jgi:hypothetical protein
LQISASDAWNLIGYVVASFGGIVVISIAITAWLGKRAADRLYLKWKNDYDRGVEVLKDQLSTTRTLLQTALSSASQVQLAAQGRVLSAVEVLWASIMEIHDYACTILFMYEILLPKEYNENHDLVPRVSRLEHAERIDKFGKSVAQCRPFLGERLWTHFWVYRAIMGRLCFKVIEGHDRGTIYPWDIDLDGKQDSHLLALVGSLLSEEEMASLAELQVGVPGRLLSILEQRILGETERIISGRQIGEIGVEDGRRLREMLLKAEGAVSRT